MHADSHRVPGRYQRDDFEQQEGEEISSGGSNFSGISSKSAALNSFKKRLQDLTAERHTLEEFDKLGHERIDNEVERIEMEIVNIQYSKTDDPELEKNRKKIFTSIKNAKNNIQKLEIEKGYKDAPVYAYLDRFIDTGMECVYTPPVDNPPNWTF